MSTYLVAFLVGAFQCTSGREDAVDIRVCATPDKVGETAFALDIAKFALHYYDDYFGIHFPLKKLDFIGIPDFEAGAMENFGAITLPRNRSPGRPWNLPLPRLSSATQPSQSRAKWPTQWFGDLVTMQWCG